MITFTIAIVATAVDNRVMFLLMSGGRVIKEKSFPKSQVGLNSILFLSSQSYTFNWV